MIGGGYALPPVEGHALFLFETAKRFQATTQQPLLIAFLEYSKHITVNKESTHSNLGQPFQLQENSPFSSSKRLLL